MCWNEHCKNNKDCSYVLSSGGTCFGIQRSSYCNAYQLLRSTVSSNYRSSKSDYPRYKYTQDGSYIISKKPFDGGSDT